MEKTAWEVLEVQESLEIMVDLEVVQEEEQVDLETMQLVQEDFPIMGKEAQVAQMVLGALETQVVLGE